MLLKTQQALCRVKQDPTPRGFVTKEECSQCFLCHQQTWGGKQRAKQNKAPWLVLKRMPQATVSLTVITGGDSSVCFTAADLPAGCDVELEGVMNDSDQRIKSRPRTQHVCMWGMGMESNFRKKNLM